MGILLAPFRVIVRMRLNNKYSTVFTEAHIVPDTGLSKTYRNKQNLEQSLLPWNFCFVIWEKQMAILWYTVGVHYFQTFPAYNYETTFLLNAKLIDVGPELLFKASFSASQSPQGDFWCSSENLLKFSPFSPSSAHHDSQSVLLTLWSAQPSAPRMALSTFLQYLHLSLRECWAHIALLPGRQNKNLPQPLSGWGPFL